MLINFTPEEIGRIRLIVKMMRRKLSLGEWILNDEEITLADVALLQRIVDSTATPTSAAAVEGK